MTPVATQPPERTPVSALQPTSTEETPSAQPGVILGSSTPRDIVEMIQIYERNVQEHGYVPRTLLYPNDELHEAKVKQYCDILLGLIQHKQIMPGDSLLDIGCGYGSLAKRLKAILKVTTPYSIEQFPYTGIDVVPKFIDYAQSCFKSSNLIFEEVDLVEYTDQEKDWCILLGVVNSVPNPEELVKQAFSKCGKGLLVDFNDYNKASKTKFNKFDIDAQIERLYQLGANHVEIRCDDPDYIWTILLAER
jgi:SAM-dependent methyltransferase